ncbi:MAG TPA: SusC/RagA family TonB-linked outer membrane protein, partial [Flavisolibacter sp.]|nr:SusC/RagA family TonB-linked outer membrane protein [Flavisolibacter sp.]
MRKLLYAIGLPLFLLFSFVGFAQDKVVSGRVTDSSGRGIAGVSVSVKGQTARGTTTTETGNYSLSVPAGATALVFSSIGYGAQEVSIANLSTANVTLQATSGGLNEVVVIGYGTARRRDLTGSVATVTSKDFQKGVVTTPEQLIAGRVPGVQITSNSGQPGAGSTIRIRGGSSLTASNDPLIVVDGVPLENSSVAGASNQLSFINPNDIESFSILKDASAAAIYGTRASNGVIIITTKKGSSAKLRVSVTSTNSVSAITKKVDVLNADQFRAIVNEKGTAAQKAMLGSANTDWQDIIYQNAYASDNNISLSGGIKNLPYRLSFGFLHQTGVLRTDKLQRQSVSLALNPVLLNNHLRVNLNLNGSLQDTRFANTGAIGAATSFDPTQPVYAKSSRFGGYFEWLDPASTTGLVSLAGRNPLGLLEQRIDKSSPKRSLGNLQLDYKFHFLPDLHANLNVGYDIANGSGTIFVSDSAASDYVAGGKGGQNNYYKTTRNNNVLDFYLNYVKDLKSINSRIDATAGYSYNHFLTTRYNYASYFANGTKVPNSDPAFATSPQEHNLVSFFGRVNYNFKERYLLTATLRRDGSSRFGPDYKWGMFPSFAFAWKLKEESFFRGSQTVSDLKLRLGYGITGQQDIGPNYAYLAAYSLSSNNATYPFGNEYYQMYRAAGYNPNLKWEQTATTNIGLDYGFAGNRITGTLDVYYKKTTDLLNNIPQPAGSNFAAFFIANVGSMENKGVEFAINGQVVRNNNFTWEVGYNITYNKNEILNLTVVPGDTKYRGIQAGGISGGVGGGFAQIQAVGYSQNTFN